MRWFFSQHMALWSSGCCLLTRDGAAVVHGLVAMKCQTVVPGCVPSTGEVDGNACGSQDEAVDRERRGHW